MYFRVSYDAVGYNSLVCAVRFQDLLQQLEFLLIYVYILSLVPRPKKGRRKGPGFHCLRMRLIIRNRNTYS